MMKLSFKLPVSILKEGKRYVAYTPVLDLSTSAKTYERVQKRFVEIVNIFFEETIKRGTLDMVMENLGWEKVKKQWIPPVIVSQKMEDIKILVKV